MGNILLVCRHCQPRNYTQNYNNYLMMSSTKTRGDAISCLGGDGDTTTRRQCLVEELCVVVKESLSHCGLNVNLLWTGLLQARGRVQLGKSIY